MNSLARRAVIAVLVGLAIVALPKMFLLATPYSVVKERPAAPAAGESPAYSPLRGEETTPGTGYGAEIVSPIAIPAPPAESAPASEETLTYAVSREGPYRLALLFAAPLATATFAFLAAKLVLK